MLLPFAELARFRGLVTMVDGSFDPLHPGHLQHFHRARSFGLPLLVNLCPDAYTATKHPILLPANDRARVLDDLGVVQYVHPADLDTAIVLNELRPRIYAKGDDWKGRLPLDQQATCAQHGIQIEYTGPGTYSSSALLQKLQPDVDAFERLVQQQQPASVPWQPVTDYSFDGRKAIEGRHPELIRDVFQPRLVLDAGCGPGHLVSLLLGQFNINAYGFDLCPPNGDRFFRDDLCCDLPLDEWDTTPLNYDLVLCREVLEHLTIRQIRQAVTNLCGLSSRFVYVTTRFSPARHFLDFQTHDGLDPTHISIMPIDWLRHLFVLEGFKRRADLEQRMDWMNKKRVLVYERD